MVGTKPTLRDYPFFVVGGCADDVYPNGLPYDN
jgi:hypothetical protein